MAQQPQSPPRVKQTGNITVTTTKKKQNQQVTSHVKVQVLIINGKPLMKVQHEGQAVQTITKPTVLKKFNKDELLQILNHFVGQCMYNLEGLLIYNVFNNFDDTNVCYMD